MFSGKSFWNRFVGAPAFIALGVFIFGCADPAPKDPDSTVRVPEIMAGILPEIMAGYFSCDKSCSFFLAEG